MLSFSFVTLQFISKWFFVAAKFLEVNMARKGLHQDKKRGGGWRAVPPQVGLLSTRYPSLPSQSSQAQRNPS